MNNVYITDGFRVCFNFFGGTNISERDPLMWIYEEHTGFSRVDELFDLVHTLVTVEP